MAIESLANTSNDTMGPNGRTKKAETALGHGNRSSPPAARASRVASSDGGHAAEMGGGEAHAGGGVPARPAAAGIAGRAGRVRDEAARAPVRCSHRRYCRALRARR